MRILRLAGVPDNRTGGMSRYMHFVADELRAAGHTVEMAFADELAARVPDRLGRFVTPLRVLSAVLGRLARGRRYDVVDIHEPVAAAYAVARRAAPALPPLVACVYALEARAFEARAAYARSKGRPLPLRSRLGAQPVLHQSRLALRLADYVTVETAEDAEYVRRRLGVPARRVGFLHGGVDAALFPPEPGRPRDGVLFVGTWIERKGILELVPAVCAVLERHPTTPVTLAGTGFAADRVLADFPAHLRGRVRVLPSVADDRRLAAEYRSHRVFAFPSTFEGQPLALLEAAAAGLGIATTRTCGMRDFVRDGENGLLAGVGDGAGFTAALLRLVGDPALAGRLGEAARRDAAAFTWERSAGQFLAAAEAAASRGKSWRA